MNNNTPKSETNKNETVERKKMLAHSFKQISKPIQFRCLDDELIESPDPSLHTIGIVGIQKKFDDKSYTKFQDYIDDINQLARSYKADDRTFHEMVAASELQKRCKRDMKSIEMCAECYEFWINENENEFFKRVCSIPHLL